MVAWCCVVRDACATDSVASAASTGSGRCRGGVVDGVLVAEVAAVVVLGDVAVMGAVAAAVPRVSFSLFLFWFDLVLVLAALPLSCALASHVQHI